MKSVPSCSGFSIRAAMLAITMSTVTVGAVALLFGPVADRAVPQAPAGAFARGGGPSGDADRVCDSRHVETRAPRCPLSAELAGASDAL